MTYRQRGLSERIGNGTTRILDGSTPDRLCPGHFRNRAGRTNPGCWLLVVGNATAEAWRCGLEGLNDRRGLALFPTWLAAHLVRRMEVHQRSIFSAVRDLNLATCVRAVHL